jgi:hypothetical protein
MHVGNNRTSFLMDKALPAQSMKAMNDERDNDPSHNAIYDANEFGISTANGILKIWASFHARR